MFLFCCTLLYVHSSIAIILMGKRELVALFNLSSWCLVMVEQLFLAVPRGCLRFVIVVFPDHTHLFFLQSLVHSQLEYASAVWDLHTKDRTHESEMVQRRAAWCTLSEYTSATSLQSHLNWQTLEGRRSVARLCLFYKFVNGLVAVLLPYYM